MYQNIPRGKYSSFMGKNSSGVIIHGGNFPARKNPQLELSDWEKNFRGDYLAGLFCLGKNFGGQFPIS